MLYYEDLRYKEYQISSFSISQQEVKADGLFDKRNDLLSRLR